MEPKKPKKPGPKLEYPNDEYVRVCYRMPLWLKEQVAAQPGYSTQHVIAALTEYLARHAS